MLPLGTKLPKFDLAYVTSKTLVGDIKPEDLARKTNNNISKCSVLVMVLCAHCPFVKHIEKTLTLLDNDYRNKLQILAVASNSLLTHPQDSPHKLVMQLRANGWSFPYLLDLDQSFAKELRAACTPDFFLFGSDDHLLKYRGQLDGSRPGNDVPSTGEDLRASLDAVLNGKEVSILQKPSIGCNIKWHPGNEPSWF